MSFTNLKAPPAAAESPPDVTDKLVSSAKTSAVAIDKGNEDLLEIVNKVIAEQQEQGNFDKWVEKYSTIAAKTQQISFHFILTLLPQKALQVIHSSAGPLFILSEALPHSPRCVSWTHPEQHSASLWY